MSHAIADCNLLFGILALQMDFVSRDGLIAAMNAWVVDKARSLGAILEEQGALTADEHAALETLVLKHLRRHGDDPQRSLAAVATPSVRAELSAVEDRDVQFTLSGLKRSYESGVEATAAYAPSDSASRYRILRRHARGGLGEVFVAEDRELHREVALKEIQPEHAQDPGCRSRFLLEAEVNGRLEHPGIVPVYGLGAYPDGRPYYAMRFIQGETLRDAIRHFHDADRPGHDPAARSLPLRQLLGRFVAVCHAVGYAHSRGVVHRDIKPANVLLGQFGETLLVDWGLAKIVGRAEVEPAAGENTVRPASAVQGMTQMGVALGTPAYMSPEQAAGRLDQVGPRSDIHGLGATLYTLLTGRAPYEGADTAESVRRACTSDWLPPGQVKKGVPKALEAICCRAMAPRPQDRYPSATALAADMECWLAGAPVGAYPEPWSVRARRWLARHRTLATATAATVLVATLSLGAATVLLKGANDRERQARDGEREARLRAEANFGLARDAVDRYFTKVSDSPQLKAHGLESLRRDLLQQARDFYEKLARNQSDDPGLRAEHGRTYLRLADITAEMGSPTEAIPLARQAQALFAALLSDSPAAPEYQDSLAAALSTLGRNSYETKQVPQAQSAYEAALGLRERLVQEQPNRADYRLRLAVVLNEAGKLYRVGLGQADRGEEAYRKALRLCDALAGEYPKVPEYRSELARTLHHLAESYYFDGKSQRAIETFSKARPILEKLVEEDPVTPSYRDRLAETLHDLAIQYSDLRQWRRTRELCEQARPICERLVREHSLVPAYQDRLTRLRVLSAQQLAHLGDHAQTAIEIEAAVGQSGGDGHALYNGACGYAFAAQAARQDKRLSASERDELTERYLGRAVGLLRRANAAGTFRDAAAFEYLKKNDHDLDPLRGREDFQSLVRDVEAKARPRP
jgi:serine/threonine-protein kinase